MSSSWQKRFYLSQNKLKGYASNIHEDKWDITRSVSAKKELIRIK